MQPHTFKNRMRETKLYRPNIGLTGYNSLRVLAKEPQPLQPTRFKSKTRGAPSLLPQMGLLISNGFAKLDRTLNAYVATDAGREWLAQINNRVFNTQHA